MPNIEIDDLTTASGRWRTVMRMQAAMLFPHAPDEQSKLLATLGGLLLSGPRLALEPAEKAFRIGSELMLPLAADHAEVMFEEHGGLRAVVEAPAAATYRQLVDASLGDWFTAGSILELLLGLAVHPDFRDRASVGIAAFVLPHVRRFPTLMPANRKDIFAAWTRYRDVAHLCATYQHVCYEVCQQTTDPVERPLRVNEYMANETEEFLQHSSAYQFFGLTYKLPRSRGRTPLAPSTAYRVPMLGIQENSIPVPRLAEAIVSIARKYRAPKRAQAG